MLTGRREKQIHERLVSILQGIRLLMNSDTINTIRDVCDQHIKLLQKFDGFAGAILYGHLDPSEIDALAHDFIAYLGIHFAVEETLMTIIEYSDIDAHQRRHRIILEDGDLAVLIGNWLLDHESTTDGYLTKYVQQLF